MNRATVHHLATSCFPNCHPAGWHQTSAIQQSGNVALALAFLGIIILIAMKVKGK